MEMFRTVALPGVEGVAEPDSQVWVREGYDSIQRPYNEMLDRASKLDDLEALILVHQDLELLDDSLIDRVRPLLAEPRVGLIGLFGGRDIPAHTWSETADRYGRSMTPTIAIHHSRGAHEVEVVDGALLVIAPWVVRMVRFDERLARDFHGYDVDFSLRVRAAGGRVICSDIPYLHQMSRPWTDIEA